jgi:hypothetical protein
MRLLFGSVLVGAALISAVSAQACDLGFVCGDIKMCLREGVDNDIGRIKVGAASGNGQLVYDGTDACWHNFDNLGQHNYRTWRGESAGCSNPTFASEAQDAVQGACHYPSTRRRRS